MLLRTPFSLDIQHTFLLLRPVLEPFMCDDNACTYDDAMVCDDPNCASNFGGRDLGNRNSYVPLRNYVAAYSWKKHCAGVAALIGITVVAAICIVVATRPEESRDPIFDANKAGMYI